MGDPTRERQCSNVHSHGPHSWRVTDLGSPVYYCRGIGEPPTPRLATDSGRDAVHRQVHRVLASGMKCPDCGFVQPETQPATLTLDQQIRAIAIQAAGASANPALHVDDILSRANRFARYIEKGSTT